MDPVALQRRLAWGRRLGQDLPGVGPEGLLVLAECVPGGTSTAEAVLSGLGC